MTTSSMSTTSTTSGVEQERFWWRDGEVQARDEAEAVRRTGAARWTPQAGVASYVPLAGLQAAPGLARTLAWVQADVQYRTSAAFASPGGASPARDVLRTAYWACGYTDQVRLELALSLPVAPRVIGRSEDALLEATAALVDLGLRAGSPVAAFHRFALAGAHPAAAAEGWEASLDAGHPGEQDAEQSAAGPVVEVGQGCNQADLRVRAATAPDGPPAPAPDVAAAADADVDGSAELAAELDDLLSAVEGKGVCGGPECWRWVEADAEPLPGWAHAAAQVEQRPVELDVHGRGWRFVPSRLAHTVGGYARVRGPEDTDVRIVALDDYPRVPAAAPAGTFHAALASLLAYGVLALTDQNERALAAAAGLTAQTDKAALLLLRLAAAEPFTTRMRLYRADGSRFSEVRNAESKTLRWRLCWVPGTDDAHEAVESAVWRDEAGKHVLVLRRAGDYTVTVNRARVWDSPDPATEVPVDPADPEDQAILTVLQTELTKVGLRLVTR